MLHSHNIPVERYSAFNNKTFANINTPPVQLWRQTAAVINLSHRCLTAGVVNCYKRSATLEPVYHSHRPLC